MTAQPLKPFGMFFILDMLISETASGICVGCALQSLFDKVPPKYCPGGACSTDSAHTHAPTHSKPAQPAP